MPRLSGLLGAALAITAWVVVAAFPRTLSHEARTHGTGEPGCGASGCEPEADPLVEAIDAQIAARMPGLADGDRTRLASTIVLEAEAARIDPLLVLALIEVESSFDARALSGAGAKGLMQLRESTLRRELERVGLPAGDPHDPVLNVRAGVRYLRRLLDAFGREEVALMAYNAGPNRILGYLREGAIPQRFHVYPRRVKAELRRIRRDIGDERPAEAVAAAAAPAPVAE
ncbi:Lytic transglycosylase catalytic [Anaeromyxobacter dehalogenans 2CP-1]|uniref:Lytic transglycosylase catalytic n=1 Tax=Anaeromyxobacter dehalogenans (strain ATCC BAA-258 / DSM 21875 / 2CP-1) TaxID=455488 RepID=B8JDE7_ANAD2|nr:lytic transglycosylase domain-containing protein [Anaeromyxobacter dehalogenans]ACL65996.1 Lytic transglycosylase catalytic [Anaeromyxobacter dehalogenans 2CP-1]